MIQDYEVKRNINTSGDTASLFFGIKADNVPLKDAIETESEFTRFLSRVTGKITTTAKPSETRGIIWITDETETVRDATSVEDAWQAYHRKFPQSLRSRDAIKKKWMELHKTPAPADKPTDGLQGGAPASTKKPEVATVPEKPPVQKKKKKSKKEANAKNAMVPAWTDDQKTLVKGCKTKEEAWERFKEKYPGQRNENAVWQRFNLLKKADTSKPSAKAIPPSNNVKEPPAAETTTTPEQSSDNVVTPAPADSPIGIGDSVKQVSGTRICTGTGKVKRAPQGRQEVLVEFSNGQEWISRSKLQKVAA